MSKPTKRESLQPVFEGFLKISDTDKREYLKYFNLLIERQQSDKEKNKLIRFKRKLEKAINESCFRHLVEPKRERCRLCEVKEKAKGKTEYARRIFIKGK